MTMRLRRCELSPVHAPLLVSGSERTVLDAIDPQRVLDGRLDGNLDLELQIVVLLASVVAKTLELVVWHFAEVDIHVRYRVHVL